MEGHLVDSVLKQCLCKLGGVQALDFTVAPKFKRSRAPNCGDGDHQPKRFVGSKKPSNLRNLLVLRMRMEPHHIEEAYEMFRGIFVALSPFLRPPTHDNFFFRAGTSAPEPTKTWRPLNGYCHRVMTPCQSCVAGGQYFVFELAVFFYSFFFKALCQDSPISMMSPGERRDAARHIQQG